MTRFERCLSLFGIFAFDLDIIDRYSILFQVFFSRHFNLRIMWLDTSCGNIPRTKSSFFSHLIGWHPIVSQMPPKLRREVAEKAGALPQKWRGGWIWGEINLVEYDVSSFAWEAATRNKPSELKAARGQQIHKWKTSSVFQESGVHRSQVEGRCVLLFRRVLPWTLLAVGAFWRMVFVRSNKNPKKRMMS